jgi:hypothetical protein
MAQKERTPWIIAGVALAGLLAVLLVMIYRDSESVIPEPAVASAPAGPVGEVPPDISNMSPRERFNRLYNRIMTAAQAGDEATAQSFMPMALRAYEQLDTVDADARYHAALLKAHTGDVEASRALGDTILTQHPGHLFGYVVRGTVARFQKDQEALDAAYVGFLKRYDEEIKANRQEYGEHRTSLEEFRKAALQARGSTGPRR